MSKFFVNKSNLINIDVYVWDNDDQVEATHEKGQVPSDKEIEAVTFKFERPNYADSNDILRHAQIGSGDGGVDVTAFQDTVLRQLCKDWTITDDDNEKVSVTAKNISNLEPSIARAAVEGVLQKIKL